MCSVVTEAVAIVWYVVLLQVCIVAKGDMKCFLW